MVLIMMCSMLTMEFVPKLPGKVAKLLPSSLLAILVAIFLEYVLVRNIDCTGAPAVPADLAHRRMLAATPYSANASATHTGKVRAPPAIGSDRTHGPLHTVNGCARCLAGLG